MHLTQFGTILCCLLSLSHQSSRILFLEIMAEAIVGGAFLSGFVNVVMDRLISAETKNLIQGKKLDQELVERLKTALRAARALLTDAEHKQFHDPDVKDWLDTLKDAVYVADDLLDGLITKAATQKEVSSFLPRVFNFKDRQMVNEMEKVVARIEDIEKRRYILGLKEVSRENMSWRTPSTSLVGGTIYGREKDQDVVTKMLNDNSEDKLFVIPIVGLGGVGKTTLAQWVYNNDSFMKEFDLKAWVCVSEEFNISMVTKTIVTAISRAACYTEDMNLLQLELQEKLAGKKFFIVMDDVWNEDCYTWHNLIKPFQYGAKGSKILVTTRSKDVASVCQIGPLYHLQELSDEYCWSVFANNAHFSQSNGDPTLEEIGRKVVKKCKGLPLAAETLGGLLGARHDTYYWNTILNSEIWEFSLKDSKITPALLISYYQLPSYLKRCFAYCSLYPKDYKFVKDELILLWMAEDLLRSSKRGETLEEVGCECFNDLVARLFFKQFNTYGNSFVMHDLVHDLAIFVAGDLYCRLQELGKAADISLRTRHLSYETLSHPISKNFDVVSGVKYLRTFLQIDFSSPLFNYGSAAFIIPSKFQYLRVLSFTNCQELEALPDSIGELIHLRYLDFSFTGIKLLPESLSNLYNLQTLKLRDCYKLTMLPSGMQNLVNLRHLDVTRTALKKMPAGMSRLKSLQFLNEFVVGKHQENGIKELGALSNLHGSFRIRKLENISNSSEATEARMMDKRHIRTLTLGWSESYDTPNSQNERDILDKLKPHRDLQQLRINGYRGTIFPIWVGQSFYHIMTSVSLESCNNCCMLPSLGTLPLLKSLKIENFKDLEIIGAEFYKNDDDDDSCLAAPFPSLEELTLCMMSSWEKWHSCEFSAFPQLKYLTIDGCPKLTGDLPNHLPALKTLRIWRCPCLSGELSVDLPDLETLEIEDCDQLASSLPRAPAIGQLIITGSEKVRLEEIPLSLQSLTISGCQLVESMFQAANISHTTCLKELHISDCSSAISFPGGSMPLSLTTLGISDCRKLEFPTQQHHLLHTLYIESSFDTLTSFPLDSFPNLDSLRIINCENLESLSVSQSQVVTLHSLRISNCPSFVWFRKEGLDAPNMKQFAVYNCEKLKSLPSRMHALLPKLQQLEIIECPEIESFPAGGLPPNLETLSITHSQKLSSLLSSMAVHHGLTRLDIRGYGIKESVKSFPATEGLLTKLPSLTSLHLFGFSRMETLECKELLHLTSLQTLLIHRCEKLQNIEGERLPASLIKLEIYRCPLLEERCEMKHPQILAKISHIPGIRVNDRWISQ